MKLSQANLFCVSVIGGLAGFNQKDAAKRYHDVPPSCLKTGFRWVPAEEDRHVKLETSNFFR